MFPIFKKLSGDAARLDPATLDELRALSGRRGWPKAPTLALWARNGKISGPAVTWLMEIADRRGVRYCAADFRADPS
jgi:hypothetical protein